MTDPDLQIRGGGGGRGGHPDPEDKLGGGLQKFFFRPFGPQFGLKITGGGTGSPCPSPRSATIFYILREIENPK